MFGWITRLWRLIVPTVPQTYLDAVTQLDADFEELQALYIDLKAKRAAEAASIHARQVAENAVAAKVGKIKGDKAAIAEFTDSLFPTDEPPDPPPGTPPEPPPLPVTPAGPPPA